MPKARWSQTFAEYALCAVAFLIPFPFIYGTIAIGILAFAWLTQLNFKETFINLTQCKALWLWIIFYLLHVISYYYYSDNKEQASFDLQQKISFIILPVLVGAGISINKKAVERLFFAFVSGMSVIAMWCMIQGVLKWNQTHETGVFFYHELIKGLEANAVYMAWYCVFSISLLLFMNWELFFKNRFIKIVVTLIQIAFFILLSSRMLLVLFFIVLIPVYLRKSLNKFSKAKLGGVVGLLAILFGTLIFTNNPIRSRYENLFHVNVNQAFLNNYSTVAEGDFSNLTFRLFLWRIGIMNLNEHGLWLTGAGTGDVKTLQNKKMDELGIRNMNEPIYKSPFKDSNLHNMYMQSLLMLGIIGLVTFIFISFLPLFNIHYIPNPTIFLLFHIIAIAFMMQEATLQTQAGIVYYTFFSQVFWNIRYGSIKQKINNYC